MKSKLIKDKMFIQSFGTYSDEIFVIIGIHDKRQILKYLKKIKALFPFSKWVLESIDEWNTSLKDTNKGQLCWNDSKDTCGCVLMLRTPVDTWDYWEVLMHECHHAVQHIAKRKGFLEEAENQAYLQEFLFHSLRRKLQGVDSVDL
jgi:hypothetical protein